MSNLLQRCGSWLLPHRRNRYVPWSGFEVFVVVVLSHYFWSTVLGPILQQTGFFGWIYGPTFAQHMAEATDSPLRQAEIYRANMWLAVLGVPLKVATIIGVPALLSGMQPYQLGLTTYRFARNVLIGALGAVFVAPLHVLVKYLNTWYLHISHVAPTKHPLTVVAEHALPVDRVLIVLTAVVAAPLVEELLFRGFLQPWFIRRRAGGALALLFALALALFLPYEELKAALINADRRGLLVALQPAAFVVILAPLFYLTRYVARPNAAGGILGTALLFAIVHSRVWPSPVPLLPLGIVLGWLAYRTNSLVAPIVLHALFNSVACVEMFFLMSR